MTAFLKKFTENEIKQWAELSVIGRILYILSIVIMLLVLIMLFSNDQGNYSFWIGFALLVYIVISRTAKAFTKW